MHNCAKSNKTRDSPAKLSWRLGGNPTWPSWQATHINAQCFNNYKAPLHNIVLLHFTRYVVSIERSKPDWCPIFVIAVLREISHLCCYVLWEFLTVQPNITNLFILTLIRHQSDIHFRNRSMYTRQFDHLCYLGCNSLDWHMSRPHRRAITLSVWRVHP